MNECSARGMCGGVNENDVHRLIVWNVWHYLRGIRRHSLVGGGVSLGVGFGVSKAKANPSVSLFLPLGSRCRTLLLYVCLHAAPLPVKMRIP